MKNRLITAAVLFGLFGSATYAQEIESATSLLTRITATTQKSPTTAPVGDLKSAIGALAKTVADLPPDEAATRWLALVDRQAAGSKQAMMDGASEPVAFSDVAKALPAPPQWPALAAAVAKRPAPDKAKAQHEALLKLFVAALQNDPAAINQSLTAVKDAMIARGAPADMASEAYAKLNTALNEADADPTASIQAFEADLANSDGNNLTVPDLVTFAGPEKAETLLRKALVLNRQLEIRLGDETVKLARKLALEMIDKLAAPQWSLCYSVDNVELYEAMNKQFPPPSTQPTGGGLIGSVLGLSRSRYAANYEGHAYERSQATQYYLLGLIAKGRTDDAFKLAKQFGLGTDQNVYVPSDGLDALDKAGLSKQVFAFLKQVVLDDPNSQYWDSLLQIAARAGAADQVLQIARDAVAKPDLSDNAKLTANKRLVDALMAADKLDEAVPKIRELQKLRAGKPGLINDRLTLDLRLATLGRLTKQPALVAEGLDAANAEWGQAAQAAAMAEALEGSGAHGIEFAFDTDTQETWFREMLLADRLPQAVHYLGDQLTKATHPSNGRYDYISQELDRVRLRQLAEAYYRANRPDDIIVMLDTFPQWEAGDLVKLRIESGIHHPPIPVAFYAAWALAKVGRTAEAQRTLDFVLNERGGLDPAYALLLEINPQPIAQLDALFARDQFEERPLIWKAVVLHKAGQLDEAEKAARQAISIDPSDGEEGKGDRMRVYAVLADILQDKGDAKNTQFFREVVAAIRVAEDADDAWQANLLTRAVNMYTDALTHFSDAYCIQSRLAARLAELGMMDAAQEHYQKAYELMPDSFGRVESHCFGCEGAFNGAWAQAIAEKVFVKLLAKNPDKPQLHYLLGYLRQAQGRYADALPEFKQAVKLDPLYLNAWKELLETGEHQQLSAADREAAVLAIIKLDPLSRHGSPDVSKVRDLATLWNAEAAAAKLRTPWPDSLYPLKAAAVRLAAEKNNNRFYYPRESETEQKSPAEVVISVQRLQVIIELMGSENEMDW